METLNEYRRYFVLAHATARQLAAAQCHIAPDGYIVEIKPPTRSLLQNSKLWAMLNEVSSQVVWHGRKLTSDEWKIIFSSALKRQEVIPGIDGGFVAMGQSTSKMTKKEMADLITLIEAFGAQHDVTFSE
jgi:hypothetical protein